MKKYILSFAAVAAMLVSCSQDADFDIVENGAKAETITTISASSENVTRAVVSGTSIYWHTGDKLGVLGTDASSNAKNIDYTLSSGEGTTNGTFTNASSPITTISATMYPYQENALWDESNSKLTLEIPSRQKGVVGSFDTEAAVMYAIGSSADQSLSLAVNFLKVTISDDETNVHAIAISSPTTDLSGKMEVTSSGVTAASQGACKSVGITAGPNVEDCFTPGDYYIAVKAGDIANPSISYVYYDANEHKAIEKTKAATTTLTFAVGKNVKAISADFNSGTVTTREAIQLWAGGAFFATINANDGVNGMTWHEGMDAWGANWKLPEKTDDEFNGLFDDSKVEKSYGPKETDGTSDYGFHIVSKNSYNSVSLFLPSGNGSTESFADVTYWSGTLEDDAAWYLIIFGNTYGGSNDVSTNWDYGNRLCFVRLVLR